MSLVKKCLLVSLLATSHLHADYQGSRFEDVWAQVSSDPYQVLPQNKISYRSLFKWFKSKIKQAAHRTLDDRSDILPEFDKLAHPNGICLAGTWTITQDNPYGGYYKKGSEALIIARASTAMSETKRGELRGMALAGKLFPTLNPSDQVATASFFVADDLGGTYAPHWTGVQMTNEPKVSKTMAVLGNLLYALKLAKTFGKADKNPNIRQVYEISELGESQPQTVQTPRWMMLKAAPGQTVDEDDFRDELNIENYGGRLIVEIHVASKSQKPESFKKIGFIEFQESVTSHSCDHRLHFPHPKWKSSLKH